MDPTNPNFYQHSSYYSYYQNSQYHPQNIPDSDDQQNSSFFQNSQFSPNLTQIPTSAELPASQNISRNLFQDVQHPNKNQKGAKNVVWSVKEDVALMSAWVIVSEDNIRGKNQKGDTMWSRVSKLYHTTQSEYPNELNPRNIDSLKGRWKRLNENANKWVAACNAASTRKRSGMSQKDVEMEAHSIYEMGGSKFQDLVVFNDVMSKHPKWSLTSIDHDATRGCPQNEVEDEESGGCTKRSKTSADGEYSIHSNPKTPLTGGSTVSRPIGRDKSKRKGKGKVADGDSGVAAELRAMRITRENENQLFAAKIELEREKIKMNNLKMEKKMLANLLARNNLSPADEEVKNQLIALLFGQT